MKVAVVYYSFEGNTKMLSEEIGKKLDADIYELKEIKSSVPKTGFFKYAWGGKQVVMKEKPDLEDLNINIEEYDCIFIGTPVWAFTYAPAIRSFFSKYDIKGKKIGLFCCHEGGPGKTFENMKEALKGNEIILQFDITSPLKDQRASIEKIDSWLESLKL